MPKRMSAVIVAQLRQVPPDIPFASKVITFEPLVPGVPVRRSCVPFAGSVPVPANTVLRRFARALRG